MSRAEQAPSGCFLTGSLPPCSSRCREASAREPMCRHAQLDSAALHLAERLSPYKNKHSPLFVSKLPTGYCVYFCMARSKII